MVKIFEENVRLENSKKGNVYKIYGLKDENDNIILNPTFKFYCYNAGIFVFSDKVNYSMGENGVVNKFYNAVYYNEKGQKVTQREIKEGYCFNKDGFAVVAPSDLDGYDGIRYALMTKKGFISGFGKIKPEEANLYCPSDLIEAIKDCGAVAIKYANYEVIGREKLSKKTFIQNYKEALKEYLKNLSYNGLNENECRKIIKAEFELFKQLINEKLVIIKKEKNEKLKKQKLNGFIDNLLK